MSVDLLVACGETVFRFDNQSLRNSAVERWTNATVVEVDRSHGRTAELEIYIPGSRGDAATEVTLFAGGGGIGVDSQRVEAAADVLSWLASTPGFPAGSAVLVVHWQDDVYPLRPGITAAELLADYEP